MKVLNKVDAFLKENGLPYLVGMKVSAALFALASVVAGVFGAAFVNIIDGRNVLGCFIGFLIGCCGPVFILVSSNKSDNENMLEDIKLIFEMLKIQAHAGVYMIDALDNCTKMIKNKRLKNALLRLLNDIFMSRNVTEALDEFNSSFRNVHIDTLVIILKQSMESGYSVNNLDSAFEHVIDVERAINIKLENEVERNTQILQVLFMAGIVAIAVYCSIVEFKELFVFL